MSAKLLLALLVAGLCAPSSQEEAVFSEGESLFDEPPASSWNEGESLMDDSPAAAQDDGPAVNPNEISFGIGTDRKLTADITFDDAGNVEKGGSTDPDIAFWHIVAFGGKRTYLPGEAADQLLAALEAGEDYEVTFAPPDLSNVKCTEKVELLSLVLDRDWHDMPPELTARALETLAEEGVFNTKHLGDLYEKDYDAIRIPATIKSRLRPIREEAQRQAATANNKVDLDSQLVEDELRQFQMARGRSSPQAEAAAEAATSQANATAPQEGEQAAVEDEAEDGTLKSLIWAIMNCPTCKGKETVGCLKNCRYGVNDLGQQTQAGTWTECLDKCITNRWIRSTFYVLLPKDAK